MVFYVSERGLSPQAYRHYVKTLESPALQTALSTIGANVEDLTLKILLSFAHHRTQNLDKYLQNTFSGGPIPRIMADSGAFTAYRSGQPIGVHEYQRWLFKWRHRFDMYANLDVIRNPKGTWENQKRLEDVGLRPLPVFHFGSPWSYLEYYLDHYYIIGLGNLVGKRYHLMKRWIASCFKRSTLTGAGYHGFGMTHPKLITIYPWFSLDSTSWSAGVRFGYARVFDWHQKKFARIYYGTKKIFEPTIADTLNLYGISPNRLYNDYKPRRKTSPENQARMRGMLLLSHAMFHAYSKSVLADFQRKKRGVYGTQTG